MKLAGAIAAAATPRPGVPAGHLVLALAARAGRAALLVPVLCGCAACGAAAAEPGPAPAPLAPAAADGEVRSFAFVTLDGGVVSTATLRGRMSLIVLVASYDTLSQAQVLFVRSVVKRHVPRLNALVLALEPEQNRPVVETFATSLDLGLPVAMADEATIAGRGPFPGLHHVPSVLLLDRDGREVWRNVGLATREQIERAISKREPALPSLGGR